MLGQVFCIDVCAYAVMSNHYHVVLHINREAANQLDTRAIHERWNTLFKGNVLSARYLRHEPLCDAELALIEELAIT
jgi:hypothetical protein